MLLLKKALFASLPILILLNDPFGYPVDGYKLTGIRRLERLRLRLAGELKGPVPVEGARKSISDVMLHLQQSPADTFSILPEPDEILEKQIKNLLAKRHQSYSLALLDISPGQAIRFASHRANRQYAPGSVGKLAIAVGLFTELQALFPDSVKSRQQLLRDRLVVADKWIYTDHHKVPLFNPETRKVSFRPIKECQGIALMSFG